METKPENCIVWGERNDIDSWIQSCDVHFFSSRLELNPLSIKESLEYGKPTMIFNLGTYKGKYDNVKNAHFLSGDLIKDSENLLKILDINTMDRLSSPPNSPKIRVVHLLLDPNESEDLPPEKWKSNIDRQNFSIECWSRMKDKFFDYIPRYTRVNRSELPSENCMDPEIINHSKDLEIKFPALSYGHYGAYKAHTEGILENFSDDIDALIIAEGDSYTDLAPEDFYNKILESYKLAQQIDARLVSYAGPVYMTGGEWWNMSKDHGDWIQVPHFLLGTTYMIMRSERSGMINNILSTKWHSPDLWIAWNYHCKSTLLVSRNPLVKQKEGYSVLDYTNKW
jgi:hypothetical protein